ncbi:MBL fold metallo-hydrolase [Camelimonas fluminis]|uniref:MBL fold metallo-hydrolase n=1 Tax=Camelimonas fluminis TaxID=1576911 RepID=A0ABV7UFQ5_9HYPH|nr:MBL fold metallo-hydrolase [Camelimonas fluminis]GHE67342.1 MBL fold metallo-hydrolase [Camelimonas fluminis]
MRVTVVGCGDAFGAGGRFNTCFLVHAGGRTLALDFGASSLIALKKLGLASTDVDAVVVSHLHGDHYGGLPFLLLDSQYEAHRRRPLLLMGPPGMATRLPTLCEAMFAGTWRTSWRFPMHLAELPLRTPVEVAGFTVESIEVIHPSGAPATGLRVRHGERLLAFSGDTTWTDALPDVADGADLLILECMGRGKGRYGVVPSHLDLEVIEAKRDLLRARRIMLTHMGPGMLTDEATAHAHARGYMLAHDGLVVEV